MGRGGYGTYSASGETSEMLWEVAEWGGEGEGPVPCGGALGLGGGARTLELKEARMDERMSRCSLEGGLSGIMPEAAPLMDDDGGSKADAPLRGGGYLHEGAESSRPRRVGRTSCCCWWGSSLMDGGSV